MATTVQAEKIRNLIEQCEDHKARLQRQQARLDRQAPLERHIYLRHAACQASNLVERLCQNGSDACVLHGSCELIIDILHLQMRVDLLSRKSETRQSFYELMERKAKTVKLLRGKLSRLQHELRRAYTKVDWRLRLRSFKSAERAAARLHIQLDQWTKLWPSVVEALDGDTSMLLDGFDNLPQHLETLQQYSNQGTFHAFVLALKLFKLLSVARTKRHGNTTNLFMRSHLGMHYSTAEMERGDRLLDLLVGAGIRLVHIRHADPAASLRRLRISAIFDIARHLTTAVATNPECRASSIHLLRLRDLLYDVKTMDNMRVLPRCLPNELIHLIVDHANEDPYRTPQLGLATVAELTAAYRRWPRVLKCPGKCSTPRRGKPDARVGSCPSLAIVSWVSECNEYWAKKYPKVSRQFIHEHKDGYLRQRCRHPIDQCQGHYEHRSEWMFPVDLEEVEERYRRMARYENDECDLDSYDSDWTDYSLGDYWY